jgi:hypothetical protein
MSMSSQSTPKSGPKSRSGKLKAERKRQQIPLAAYSIPAFCVAHGISESFYYAFRKNGFGPTEMRVGDRILISAEAAARWRAERERETAAKRKAAATTATASTAI